MAVIDVHLFSTPLAHKEGTKSNTFHVGSGLGTQMTLGNGSILSNTGSISFGDENISGSGVWNLSSAGSVSVPTPTASGHAATKGYVDVISNSVTNKGAVLAWQNTPPGSPSEGDKYLVKVGTGDWLGEDNKIATYLSGSWTFSTTPLDGWKVYNQDDGDAVYGNRELLYIDDGTPAWEPFSNTVFHENMPDVNTGTYRHLSAAQVTALTGGVASDAQSYHTHGNLALASHNHAGVYSPVGHTHSDTDITLSAAPYSGNLTGATSVKNAMDILDALAASGAASGISVVTTAFNGILTNDANSDNVQKCLDKIDDHNHTGVYAPVSHTHTASQITDFNSAADLRVTFEALNTNGDVGTGAAQVAAGNHNHTGVYAPVSHTHNDTEINLTGTYTGNLTGSTTLDDAMTVLDGLSTGSTSASGISVSTTNFGGILTNDTNSDNVQKCLDKIDDHTHTKVTEYQLSNTTLDLSTAANKFIGLVSATASTANAIVDLPALISNYGKTVKVNVDSIGGANVVTVRCNGSDKLADGVSTQISSAVEGSIIEVFATRSGWQFGGTNLTLA